jgi:hypothetical protein
MSIGVLATMTSRRCNLTREERSSELRRFAADYYVVPLCWTPCIGSSLLLMLLYCTNSEVISISRPI